MADAVVAQQHPPLRGRRRFLYAYMVTLRVVLSYLGYKLHARFRSHEAAQQILRQKHLRNARRIDAAIARLHGLFIKVGQLISIMTNFLPEEFRQQLTRLQDQVPPRPYADIERRIREEFSGRGPLELFASFSPEPIASASIGQVHRACTHDGQQVAVKVQYPDIDEIVRIDLSALRRIFRIIHWFVPYHGLLDVFDEIRAIVLQELDFAREAQNIRRIAERFRNRTALTPIRVAFPVVREDLSTARVLTSSWVEGVKINDTARLASMGVDRAQLARSIVTAYCQQIFTDGLYHADPHPGNLLVRIEGSTVEVVFLDFGAVAEVSERMRHGIVEMIQAALTRDTPRLVRAMRGMGFIARGADQDIFERVIDFLHDRFHEEVKLETLSLKDVKLDPQKALENLADLRRMDVSLRDLMDHFHVPREWIMLERTVLLLLGLCTDLDPSLNPMQVIRPYLEEFVLGKERDWSQLVVDTTREVVSTAMALPSDLRKFLLRAQRGQMEVRFRGLADSVELIYTLGHQLILTACGIAAVALWVVFDGRGQPGRARWAGWGALVCFAWLSLSMLATRARLNRRRRRE
ncbi:MAG: AarF/UbiB family protein [Myxococcales bacterium]|nr:AarF/UbiB family protein [Myxococcota bacterium]MDW8280985.1 AarF/UbiB family protein [Myxococcales bacterium]